MGRRKRTAQKLNSPLFDYGNLRKRNTKSYSERSLIKERVISHALWLRIYQKIMHLCSFQRLQDDLSQSHFFVSICSDRFFVYKTQRTKYAELKIRKALSKTFGKEGKYTQWLKNVTNFNAIPTVPKKNIISNMLLSRPFQFLLSVFMFSHPTKLMATLSV